MIRRMLRTAPPLAATVALVVGIGAASAATIGGLGARASSTSVTQSDAGTVTRTLSETVPPASVPAAPVAVLPAPAVGIRSAADSLTPAGPRPVRVHAAPTAVSPAPAGSATASAVNIHPLDTCVACTNAQAQGGSSQASAQALRVLGQNLAAGQSTSTGSQSGDLIALPANPLLSLAIGDWMTAAQASGGSSTSHARSALVDLGMGNGTVATVAVLEGISNASYTDTASHGDGTTNGVDVNVGNGALVIILLHSQASSEGTRNAYVVSINGAKLVASNQNGDIPITIPGVITIHLLQVGAVGGVASAAVGRVSDVLTIPGELVGVLVSTAIGSLGAVSTSGVRPVTAALPTSGIVRVVTSPQSLAKQGPRIPATGASLAIAGFLLIAPGLATLARAMRRGSAPAST